MLKFISRNSATIAVAAILTAAAAPAAMAQSVLNSNDPDNVVSSQPAGVSEGAGTQTQSANPNTVPALINQQEGPLTVTVAPRNMQNPVATVGVVNGNQATQFSATVHNTDNPCTSSIGANVADCLTGGLGTGGL